MRRDFHLALQKRAGRLRRNHIFQLQPPQRTSRPTTPDGICKRKGVFLQLAFTAPSPATPRHTARCEHAVRTLQFHRAHDDMMKKYSSSIGGIIMSGAQKFQFLQRLPSDRVHYPKNKGNSGMIATCGATLPFQTLSKPMFCLLPHSCTCHTTRHIKHIQGPKPIRKKAQPLYNQR